MKTMDRLRAGLERTPVKVAIFTIAMGLVLTPLAVVAVPPLIDYPNHLAKAYLAISLPQDTNLAQFYEWRLRLVPNLALDFFMVPLAKLFGVYTAGRIFLAWSLVQIFLGVCLLRYALHGKVGYWPLLCIVFLYNKVLWWGFLNYLFASGLVLVLFAVWILMARWNPVRRSVVFALFMSAMFFCHLIATAVLCICVVTYEAGLIWLGREPAGRLLGQWRSFLKQGILAVAPFVPVLVLWSLSPTGGIDNVIEYNGLMTVFDTIFSPFVFRGTQVEFWLGVSAILLPVAIFSLRQTILEPRMILPVLCLLVIALLMPVTFKDVYGTHYRIPYILGCLVVAGTLIRRPVGPLSIFAVLTFAVLFVSRVAYTTVEWRAFDKRLQQYRSAIAKIEPGSKVVTSIDHRDVNDWDRAVIAGNIFWHLSALVVVDASAFDPLLFSSPIRQSVSVRNAGKDIDVMVGLPAPTQWMSEKFEETALGEHPPNTGLWPEDYRTQWFTWYRDFDYVIKFSVANIREKLVGPVTLVQSGDWFDLYRIKKSQAKLP